jgi:D-alanyl-D-alanine carboxypeptidase (penicillin-binding protein 5/6)
MWWKRSRNKKKWILFGLLLCLMPSGVCAQEDSLELYARSAVLMDGDSGRILYGKEEDTELPMASTTKIMTCIVALEEMADDTICTVSGNAAAQPQVKLGMVKDDTFYLGDLLYSLMLESHNDTAVCIAETVSGSVEAFAEQMNEKAREIGCGHTYYITPNGLDAEDETGIHHTTAKELALVMRYCLTQSPKAEEFLKITGTASYSFTNISGSRSYSCTNHNAFLSLMDGALSGKTGFTGNAGYCYVGALQRDGKLLIVALLACGWPSHKGYKWVDTKKLMNYGLENFAKQEITPVGLQTDSVPVTDGQTESVATQVQLSEEGEQVQILMREDETIQTEIELAAELPAPVKKGDAVGTVRYVLDGTVYAEYSVVAAESVHQRDYRFILEEIVGNFLL